jgi:loricrin
MPQARAFAFKQLGEKPPPSGSSGGQAGGSGSCGGGGSGGAGAGEHLAMAVRSVFVASISASFYLSNKSCAALEGGGASGSSGGQAGGSGSCGSGGGGGVAACGHSRCDGTSARTQ